MPRFSVLVAHESPTLLAGIVRALRDDDTGMRVLAHDPKRPVLPTLELHSVAVVIVGMDCEIARHELVRKIRNRHPRGEVAIVAYDSG